MIAGARSVRPTAPGPREFLAKRRRHGSRASKNPGRTGRTGMLPIHFWSVPDSYTNRVTYTSTKCRQWVKNLAGDAAPAGIRQIVQNDALGSAYKTRAWTNARIVMAFAMAQIAARRSCFDRPDERCCFAPSMFAGRPGRPAAGTGRPGTDGNRRVGGFRGEDRRDGDETPPSRCVARAALSRVQLYCNGSCCRVD